jgi:ABC-type polar amino acid transport system ATPase subunit
MTIRGLRKAFGTNVVLQNIDLDIFPGTVSFIIGPSGGGKSTLLRSMNFLTSPDQGTIHFLDERLCWDEGGSNHVAPGRLLRQSRMSMPMVFQQFNLFSHKTVIQNVIEGPVYVQRRNRKEVVDEAMEILGKVGLASKAEDYPAELSGGQKQRVGIARALAMRPRMILFDEPTSALDPELVSDVLDVIQKLAVEGITMVIVSHEMGFARKLGDVVHFVEGGLIQESGPPSEILVKPASPRLQNFISAVLR